MIEKVFPNMKSIFREEEWIAQQAILTTQNERLQLHNAGIDRSSYFYNTSKLSKRRLCWRGGSQRTQLSCWASQFHRRYCVTSISQALSTKGDTSLCYFAIFNRKTVMSTTSATLYIPWQIMSFFSESHLKATKESDLSSHGYPASLITTIFL